MNKFILKNKFTDMKKIKKKTKVQQLKIKKKEEEVNLDFYT